MAFFGCANLKSIDIPTGVLMIEDSAFCYCSELTTVKISDTVTTIGGAVFMHCKKLSNLIIGKGVTYIGWYTFENCLSLSSITFTGTVAEWDAIKKSNEWTSNSDTLLVKEIVCSDNIIMI